jgi:hypothetical protein
VCGNVTEFIRGIFNDGNENLNFNEDKSIFGINNYFMEPAGKI